MNLSGDNFNFGPVAVHFGDRTADIDGAPTATLIKAKVPTGFAAQSPVKIKMFLYVHMFIIIKNVGGFPIFTC